MKNVPLLMGSQYHYTTPCGGDYSTCPYCDSWDTVEDIMKGLGMTEEEIQKVTDMEDNRSLSYCGSCRLISFGGCTYEENGCTDGKYNGHFIAEWIDKKTGETYIGMPRFDSNQEWFDRVNDIKIVKLYCPNNGAHSSGGSYPKSTHPQYYRECRLKTNPYYKE
jgi:hypothetical protein